MLIKYNNRFLEKVKGEPRLALPKIKRRTPKAVQKIAVQTVPAATRGQLAQDGISLRNFSIPQENRQDRSLTTHARFPFATPP